MEIPPRSPVWGNSINSHCISFFFVCGLAMLLFFLRLSLISSHFSKKREFFLLTVARFFLTGDHLDSRFDTCMVFTFSYNTPRYVFWSVSRISDFNFQCFEKITADNQNFCLVLHIKIFLAPVKLKLFKAISSAFSYGLEGEFVKVPENPSLV